MTDNNLTMEIEADTLNGAHPDTDFEEASEQQSEDLLICDFSKISRRWGRRWHRLDTEFGRLDNRRKKGGKRLAEIVDSVMELDSADMTEKATNKIQRMVKQQERLSDELIKIEDKEHKLADERNAMMAEVIRQIPKEWQTDDVPDDVDWSNPDHLMDYVRDICTYRLINGVTIARISEGKNYQRA